MIALLSTDRGLYSTRALQNAFEKKGYEVQVIDVFQVEVRIGKGCYLEGQKLCPEYVVPRFSGSSLLAGVAVLREWQREGVGLLASPDALETAYSQLTTLQRLAAHAIPIPQTSFCSHPSEKTLQQLAKGGEKVVKLLDSSQGKGVTLCSSQASTKSLLTTLTTLRSSGLTQRYYPESKGADQRLICLNGDITAAITRHAAAEDFRSNLHRGGRAESLQPSKQSAALALQACRALGLNFAGVDLLQTAEGLVVLEVNASPGLEGIEKATQISVSEQLAHYVDGLLRAAS